MKNKFKRYAIVFDLYILFIVHMCAVHVYVICVFMYVCESVCFCKRPQMTEWMPSCFLRQDVSQNLLVVSSGILAHQQAPKNASVFTHTSTNIIDIHEDFLLHFYLFSHVLHPDCTFHSFLSFQSLLPQSTLLSQIHSSFFFLRKEQVSLNYQKTWRIKA